MKKNKIITVTVNPTIDATSKVDSVAPDKKLRCEQPNYEPGGGGINVSRAVKKLGGESLAAFTSGGANGTMLQNFLERENISTHPIEIENFTRQNITFYEKSGDQQFRFVMPGPELNEMEEEKIFEYIASLKDDPPEFIVGSGSLSPGLSKNFYAKLVKIGQDIGAKTIIDTSGPALTEAIKEGVFLIKPNLRELNDLTDRDIENEKSLKIEIDKILKESAVKYIALSLGSGGARLFSAEGTERINSPTVKIRSKVGAGDSMTAGIVLSLFRGKEISEAVRYGVAAGASAVTTPGIELCRLEDTERIYKELE